MTPAHHRTEPEDLRVQGELAGPAAGIAPVEADVLTGLSFQLREQAVEVPPERGVGHRDSPQCEGETEGEDDDGLRAVHGDSDQRAAVAT